MGGLGLAFETWVSRFVQNCVRNPGLKGQAWAAYSLVSEPMVN